MLSSCLYSFSLMLYMASAANNMLDLRREFKYTIPTSNVYLPSPWRRKLMSFLIPMALFCFSWIFFIFDPSADKMNPRYFCSIDIFNFYFSLKGLNQMICFIVCLTKIVDVQIIFYNSHIFVRYCQCVALVWSKLKSLFCTFHINESI